METPPNSPGTSADVVKAGITETTVAAAPKPATPENNILPAVVAQAQTGTKAKSFADEVNEFWGVK